MIDRYTIGGMKLFTAVCDRCDAELPSRRSLEDAVTAVRAAGWQSMRSAAGWRDYCPRCRKDLDIGRDGRPDSGQESVVS